MQAERARRGFAGCTGGEPPDYNRYGVPVRARERGKSVAKKPVVDKDECISCGICKTNCPQVFRFDAHGKAECYDPDGAPEEVIQNEAIDLCPVSCISWVE